MSASPQRCRAAVLSILLMASVAACSKSSIPQPFASAAVATASGAVITGDVCERLTKSDLQPLFSEPIATVEALKGDPQSCVFTTTGFSTVTVSLRPGVGESTVDAWLAGKMTVPASAVAGVGDRASWTPILKELNASYRNLLCDIGASGPASGGATQVRLAALCNKMFASV